MKQSKFEKQLLVTGKNGTITGKIVTTMNHSTTVIKAHNPSTHDDYDKTVAVHKIEGYINDKLHWKEAYLTSENMVLNEVARCEKQMLQDMDNLANSEPIKSFTEKMKDLGF